MDSVPGNPRVRLAALAVLIVIAAPAASEILLDQSFGVNGITWTSFGPDNSDTAYDLLIQADGKIITAGRSTGVDGYFVAISRHSADGVLDSDGFGSGGKVYVHWLLRDQANAIDLQEDGKIVAVGMQQASNSAGDQIESVYRFHGDGAVDTTFGGGGCVAIRPLTGSSEHGGLKVLPDGRVLAGGRQNLSSPAFHVRRYLADGTLEVGNFLPIGTGSPSPDPYNPVSCAFPDDDGIVLASTSYVNGINQFVLARVDSALNPMAGFGVNGVVQTGIEATSNRVRRVLVLSGGEILLVGTTPRPGGNTNWTALRFHSDGTPDSAFGTNGRADIAFGTTGFNVPYDVAIDAEGRILLAGRASSPLEAALARLLPDGRLDPTFSDDGKFAVNLNGYAGSHYLTRVQILPDGRILAAGFDFAHGSGDFFLARFTAPYVSGVDTEDLSLTPLSVDAYPNPSSGGAVVRFRLAREQAVTVEIFDVAGRLVSRIFDGTHTPGTCLLAWDGRDAAGLEAPAGVYFTRVSTREETQTCRLVRVR